MSPARRFVALDLGTARTRSLVLGGHAIVDRPSAILRRSSASGEADVVRPVRHGMVTDPGACLRLVRLVVRDTRLYDGRHPVRTAQDPAAGTYLHRLPAAARGRLTPRKRGQASCPLSWS